VSQNEEFNRRQEGPSRDPNRIYIIVAAVLLVIIVIAAILLITQGIPALRGEPEATPVTQAQPTATQVPTFTPGPTREPTTTSAPPSPTAPSLTMSDTDTPLFEFESAGARPGPDWTGFFGQVLDPSDGPVPGVSVIVWYSDGQPASSVVQTDREGSYEVRLADAPLAGTWTIQLLNEDLSPASKFFTFQTDENTETGIQQIQVIWKKSP
jgi:hypothetical protein